MDFFKLDRAIFNFFRYADSYTFFISTIGLYLISTVAESNSKRGTKNANRDGNK